MATDYRALAVEQLEQERYRLAVELNNMAEYEKPFFIEPRTGIRWETNAYRSMLSRRISEIAGQIVQMQAPVRRVSFKRPV